MSDRLNESGAPAGREADLSPRTARWLLALLLAGAAVLFAVGITWGLPSWHGWAGDELHPDSWERAITPETHTGWHARYPPLHFHVLHNLSRPLRAAFDRGWMDLDRHQQNFWLTLMARTLSLLMALATLAVVYLLGKRFVDRRTGLFAALIVALTAPYVYYAKMANLEAPYLLWFAVSLLFYLRLVDGPRPGEPARLWDAVLFGLAAAATVATKDPAYALYALAPLPVLLALVRQRGETERSWPGRLLRAALDRRFLAAGAAAAGGYALFQDLLFNRVRFLHHVELLLGPMSGPYREFGHGLGDQAALAWRFLQQLAFALNPLLFAACAAGVVWVGVRWFRNGGGGKGERRWSGARREGVLLGSLLLLAVSYYLTLVAVIGFTFDRYVLPVTLILALAGGRFFTLLLDRWPRPAAAGAGVPVRTAVAVAIGPVFLYVFLYAASVDTRMLADSRYTVEARVAEAMAADGTTGLPALAIGRTKHVPRFPLIAWPRVHRTEGHIVLRHAPRFVAINLTDLRHPREHAFVERMDRGELGYLRVDTVVGQPAFDFLRYGDIGTSQRFINPEIALWERVPAAAPVRPETTEGESPGAEP